MMRPLRAEIPIYLAALGPKNVALAFEIADGWIPIYLSPERLRDLYELPERDDFDIAASVTVLVDDDVQSCRDSLKPLLALYVGGMGARGKNFYNDLACVYGFEDDAKRIQDLFLVGKHREAAAAVPDAFVNEMALAGPREHIADRLDVWRESGATELLVSCRDAATLRAVAELAL